MEDYRVSAGRAKISVTLAVTWAMYLSESLGTQEAEAFIVWDAVKGVQMPLLNPYVVLDLHISINIIKA